MECLLLLSRVRRVGGGSIGLGQQRRLFCADRAALVGGVRQTYRAAEADRDWSHSILRLLDPFRTWRSEWGARKVGRIGGDWW